MAYIYAMSDIHGNLEAFEDALKRVVFSDDNKLILLGDYIDLGPESCGVLYRVKGLQEQYGKDNVIVLRGNHEEMFLDFLQEDTLDWLSQDIDFNTTKTFLDENTTEQVRVFAEQSDFPAIRNIVKKQIKNNHAELLAWMRDLPYFCETETQIFVHAGVDEDAEEWWRVGTSEETFVWKFAETTGSFYKDIIAGHISVSRLADDKAFHDIFHDGESHYYIDGAVQFTGKVLVLRYDTETESYCSL